MLSGIILAEEKIKGEKPKALFRLGGKPLIDYSLGILKEFCEEIMIVTGNPELFDKYEEKIIVHGQNEGRPTEGIFKGLEAAKGKWSIVLKCDMPYVRRELLEGMVA